MTRRAAIYARFSSDLQSDRSIEDQVALCRTTAERAGFVVVATFHDRAKSGASVFGRDGLAKMMDAAKASAFDALFVESLDRISRDQEDMAAIFKRLTFLGIGIEAAHEGKADQVQVGIRGIVSALFLTDLAHKVRRGAAGNIREGRHAGGRAYGYRPTPGKPGEWIIDAAEADIVRRIFAEYVAGERPREIARRLTAEGVAPPRGRYWRQNTLVGAASRANGILLNSIYNGELVWNRVRMVKHPDTGRRLSRVNPEGEWQRAAVPHLRIVDAGTFAAAQDIRTKRGKVAPTYRKQPRHILSGLLACGACGAGMSVKGRDRGGVRIICTRFHESKSCSHGRTYYLHHVERAVMAGLHEHLSDTGAIRRFLVTYHDERRRLASGRDAERAKLERQISGIDRELSRAVDVLLKSNGPIEALTSRMSEMETEKRAAQAALAALKGPAQVVRLHPAAVASYLAKVEAITRAAGGTHGAAGHDLAEAIRALVERATVVPTRPGEPVRIEVSGRLAALCDLGRATGKSPVGGQAGSGGSLQARPMTTELPIFRFISRGQ